jgi:hypothetical protein
MKLKIDELKALPLSDPKNAFKFKQLANEIAKESPRL